MGVHGTVTDGFARYPSLRERVVLVTGGASGIGASIVEQFVRQQARVAFLDVDEAGAKEATGALFLKCDVRDTAALRAAVEEVERRLGAVRVLVNNASNDARHAPLEVTPETWDELMAVNLKQQYFAAQAVIPGMVRAGGGSIVNMSSIAWQIPVTGAPVYVTAKAAIVGMTRALAREFGGAGVRVNAVLPGWIWTRRQRELWLTPEVEADLMEKQCLKRLLVPDEVSRLVLFLAADDSAAITNQSHTIDGGWM